MSTPTFAIIVMIDIVNSTKYVEKVGDKVASETFRLYDRIFRGLLVKYDGIEIDKTDGALLLFQNMKNAVHYVEEYHTLVEKHTGLKSRVGIHCGTVMMHSNSSIWVSRGAKPVEVEGLQKVLCARIMSLAGAGQTLTTKRASQIILSFKLVYVGYVGDFKLKGVAKPIPIYVIGKDKKRFKIPKGNSKVKLVKKPPPTNKQKVFRFFTVFIFPLLLPWSIEFYLNIIELFNFIDYLSVNVKPLLNYINLIQEFIVNLFYIDTWVSFFEWLFK